MILFEPIIGKEYQIHAYTCWKGGKHKGCWFCYFESQRCLTEMQKKLGIFYEVRVGVLEG